MFTNQVNPDTVLDFIGILLSVPITICILGFGKWLVYKGSNFNLKRNIQGKSRYIRKYDDGKPSRTVTISYEKRYGEFVSRFRIFGFRSKLVIPWSLLRHFRGLLKKTARFPRRTYYPLTPAEVEILASKIDYLEQKRDEDRANSRPYTEHFFIVVILVFYILEYWFDTSLIFSQYEYSRVSYAAFILIPVSFVLLSIALIPTERIFKVTANTGSWKDQNKNSTEKKVITFFSENIGKIWLLFAAYLVVTTFIKVAVEFYGDHRLAYYFRLFVVLSACSMAWLSYNRRILAGFKVSSKEYKDYILNLKNTRSEDWYNRSRKAHIFMTWVFIADLAVVYCHPFAKIVFEWMKFAAWTLGVKWSSCVTSLWLI